MSDAVDRWQLSPAVTRLSPPPLHSETVDRPRLVDKIFGHSRKLTIVSGPPGSGKSTLLAQACKSQPNGVWFSVEDADNDPVEFWWTLIEVIASVIPGFGAGYQQQLASGPAALRRVVPLVVNELVERGRPVRLFVDDFHLLDDEECLNSFQRFIGLVPTFVEITVASRRTPPLGLARYRLTGELVEIDEAQLKMGNGEAMAMFENLDLRLDTTQVNSLVDRLEGWVGGLHWAGIALQGQSDVESLLVGAAAADSEIALYLVEEVLDQLSGEQRRFMLETSLLSRMSASLCDAVRARSDSGRLLAELDRSNAFVIETDRAGGWYRYHHLVQEMLEARLHRQSPGDVADLHRRAARWYRERAEAPDAIRHARFAGDVVEAADTLCAHWWPLIGRGRIQTLAGLFKLFDSGEIRSYQPLAIAAAEFYSVTGNRELGRHFYQVAQNGDYDGDPPDGTTTIESTLAIMRAALVFEGVGQSLIDGELAHALEPVGSPWRPMTALFVALGRTWQGDAEGARPYFDEVLAGVPPDEPLVVYSLAELALAELAKGDVARAVETATSACARAEEAGIETFFVSATAYAAKAMTSLDAGDETTALAALRSAAEPMELVNSAMPMDAMRTQLLLVDVALRLGLLESARTYIDGAIRIDLEMTDTGLLSAQLTGLRERLEKVEARQAIDASILSTREREVLSLLPTALTMREIGAEMFVGKNTVKTHVRRIYSKLGVRTRQAAVVEARRSGLL